MHVVFSEMAFKQKQEELERHCRLRQEQGFYADGYQDHEDEAQGVIAWIVGKLFHGQGLHNARTKALRAS